MGCYASPDPGTPPQVMTQLVTLLADPSPDVRRTAAIALGRLGQQGAIEALMPVVGDADPNVRQWAAWALGVLGAERPRDVGPALVPVLADQSPAVRMAAAQALGELDRDSVLAELLVTGLQADGREASTAVAYALMNHVRIEHLPAVQQAVARAGPAARQALVAGLGELGDAQVLPVLRERLQVDVSAGVRGEAAFRLGLVGDRGIGAVLRQAKETDQTASVRRWAAQALAEVTPAAGRD